ncbi:MAG TPA: hypothetical protein VL961_10445 [Acidimicrobiales bacterium]|nr:hypothetical protein [Acidimicrobiales bacterium]
MVNVELTTEQAQALRALLETSLADMSTEIAGTDNAAYRASLVETRDVLAQVARTLQRAPAPS